MTLGRKEEGEEKKIAQKAVIGGKIFLVLFSLFLELLLCGISPRFLQEL